MFEGDGKSDKEIIAAAILREFLAPYQDDHNPTDPPSIHVEKLCDEISDYPDKQIKSVIDELACEPSGVDYDSGSVILIDRDRASNYYGMCYPF